MELTAESWAVIITATIALTIWVGIGCAFEQVRRTGRADAH